MSSFALNQAATLARVAGSEDRAEAAEEPLARAFGQHWGGEFRPVGASEHSLARWLFRHLLEGESPGACAEAIDRLELSIRTYDGPHGNVYLLHEQRGARWGRGVFAIRPGAAAPIFLQAPHTRNDVGTGLLTGDWMATLPFRAAAWNTICRRSVGRGAADLARASRSYLTALTEAIADVSGRPTIYQVHGYSVRRRIEPAARTSNVIISSGTAEPNDQSMALRAQLEAHIDGVRLFPDEVDELGATCNPVGTRLEARGVRGFVHVELSRNLRKQLRKEAGLRRRVGELLIIAHTKTAG